MRGIKTMKGIRDSFAKKKMRGEKKREHLPCVSLPKPKKKNKQSLGELVKSDYRSDYRYRWKVLLSLGSYYLTKYVLPVDCILKEFLAYTTKLGSLFGECLQKYYRCHSSPMPTDYLPSYSTKPLP